MKRRFLSTPTFFKHLVIRRRESEFGLSLPVALLTTLVIATGFATATTVLLNNFQGVNRLSLSRSARESAEAGLASLIEDLNTNYAHLLIEDNSQWSSSSGTSSAICNNSSSGMPATTGSIGTNGYWELESYNFSGSQFYGGSGEMRVRGEYQSGGNTEASVVVTQSIDIRPKSCEDSYGEPTSSSGWPGLHAGSINLGGNDVLGRLSGNVHCTSCTGVGDLGGNSTSIIGGNTSFGPMPLPPVPTPPESLSSLYDNPYSCSGNGRDKCGDIQIVSGGSSSQLLDGQCQEDSEGVTHCVIEKMIMRNNELTIDSTNGPVKLYFTGTGEVFKSTGNGGIVHIPASSDPTDLSIFGNAADPTDSVQDQEFTLRGAADTNNLWIYMPDGNLGIAGGAQDNANCEVLADGSLGECTGGDIYGSVWAKSWGETNSASSGTGVQIVVPANMGNLVFQQEGDDFRIGLRDYSALNVTEWSSFTTDTQRGTSP